MGNVQRTLCSRCSRKSYEVSAEEAATTVINGATTTKDPVMATSKTAFICKRTDLKDEEAKTFEVEDIRFLLVRRGDKFHAVGNKCTHYAAPLGKGVYCNGHIRCPWHGATFSVETGDIEDFPGLDSLPVFKVIVDGDDVKLILPGDAGKEEMKVLAGKRTRPMCHKTDDTDENTVVIVGGGAAAVACAEALRQEGHPGRIIIVSEEPHLPYDRPKLSKQMDAKIEKIILRSKDFFAKHDIEMVLNSRVTIVDVGAKTIETSEGDTMSYGKLVLATGGGARQLTCDGADLNGVCYIRTPEDTQKVAALAAEAKNIVIVGSSFIGMEAASALVKTCPSVTAVDVLPAPFAMVLGDKVGATLQQLHESNGVKFHMENGVKEIQGVDGKVTGVVLNDQTVLDADLVIAGIGCIPNTQFLKDSQVELDGRGFIPVDDCMKTGCEVGTFYDVYAIGDIVTFPLHCFGLDRVNVQHWQMAKKHGKTAALSIVGKPKPVLSVPFFWSTMFGKSLRYAGYGAGYDDVHVSGDLEALKFAAYYFKDGKLRAVGTIGMDPVAAQVAELMLAKKPITKQQVIDNSENDWSSYL